MPTQTPNPTWSRWRPFPNPHDAGILTAPFGPGLYELRRTSDKRLVLIGIGTNVAWRMSSLLPNDKGGTGTRNNKRKQNYVDRHRNDIEYRTSPAISKPDAKRMETKLLNELEYIFPT